jgi:uncharacterized protein
MTDAVSTRNETVSDSGLRAQLTTARNAAEAQDETSVRTLILRKIVCALADRDIATRSRGEGGVCAEAEAMQLLREMMAKREATASEIEETGDLERAARIREEIAVIAEFLPERLEGSALNEAVREVVEDLEAHRLKDIGRCVDALKEKYADRLDPGAATRAVRAVLG